MPLLAFELKSSRFSLLLALIFFLSSLVVIDFFLYGWMKYFCFLLVSLYGLYIIWQVVLLKGKTSIIRIRYLGDRKWLVFTHSAAYEAELDGLSIITRWLLLLHFKMPNKKLISLIFRDSLKEDHYRKLRMMLKVIT